MKYILHSKGNGYFTGKCYSNKKAYDGVEKYPIFTDAIGNAKKFTSFKRAVSFITNFSYKNPFDYEWTIKEII